MATIRDYLRLGRAQTAAVEGAGFPLAAWIGGAPLWALPLFALLGLLAHVGGFGENGITDLRYDRLDPSKATHPLVAGRMSILSALLLVFGCQAAGIGLFLGLAQYSSHLAQIPLLAFVGYIGLGHAYNVAGKWWKPGAVLSISGSFALAFLACGSAWTGHANGLIWAVTFYAFVFTAFQIAVAGELKELGQSNERNILRRLGTRIGALMGPLDGILKDLERGGAKVTRGPRAASGDFLFPSASTWELAWALSALKAVALGVVGLLLLGPVGAPWSVLSRASGSSVTRFACSSRAPSTGRAG